MNIDATVIEILPKDNIDQDFFLLPLLDYMYDISKLKNKKIKIIQYPNGKLSYSKGEIIEIAENEIIHSATTDLGSSGSPIFLIESDQVIGIHKGRDINDSVNYADFIGPIFQYFDNYEEEKIFFENGDYYIGDLLNGIPNGEGILYYNNGNIRYEGDYIDGKCEGNGIYYYENGHYYKGQFKNDLKEGKGVLYYKNGNIRYDGDFIEDKAEGNGTYTYDNGECYIGQWKNNVKHGKGIIFYKNGDIKYEGIF